MCYILSSSDSSSSFKDSCLKKESVITEQLFYNAACSKQNEVCCSLTPPSLCPKPSRLQDSSHQYIYFSRRKTPLVAGSQLTVCESKNHPWVTLWPSLLSLPRNSSYTEGMWVGVSDTFSSSSTVCQVKH